MNLEYLSEVSSFADHGRMNQNALKDIASKWAFNTNASDVSIGIFQQFRLFLK